MKSIRVTYFALVALISAVSCSKETAEPDVYDWANGKIYFKTSLADVASSRAQDMTLDGLESFQVTCFNTGDIHKNEDGPFSPYFENATFIRNESPVGIAFVSSPYEEPREWPSTGGIIKFFAFSPSLDVMAAGNSGIPEADRSNYFKLTNASVKENSTVSTDYRLGTVRVNPDIAGQFDFVTASAAGERFKDFATGVELSFSHQLSQVELRAWGAGSGYDFEIAGVRVGNPIVEGTFQFNDAAGGASSGRWMDPQAGAKDKVEYLYRGAPAASEEGATLIGDTIYRISPDKHNTAESASSIMGRGGCAMVIPTVNSKWEGLLDPNITAVPYATGKMYFSILLRVTNTKGGKQLYPYADKTTGMTVIYYAVDERDAIISRVYPGSRQGEFFADSALTQPYLAPEGVEIKEFGWAAVPVDADWSAGKRYIYTLNYSEGIGLHDPADPEPGKPIEGREAISWGVSVGNWSYATKNDDYQPDVVVP